MDLLYQKVVLIERWRKMTSHSTEMEKSLYETPSKDLQNPFAERRGAQVLETLENFELTELKHINAA